MKAVKTKKALRTTIAQLTRQLDKSTAKLEKIQKKEREDKCKSHSWDWVQSYHNGDYLYEECYHCGKIKPKNE